MLFKVLTKIKHTLGYFSNIWKNSLLFVSREKQEKDVVISDSGLIWRGLVVLVLIYLGSASDLASFFRDTVSALEGKQQKQLNFYTRACILTDASSTSWSAVDKLVGAPSVGSAENMSYSAENSAAFNGGEGEVVCEHFVRESILKTELATSTVEELLQISSSTANIAIATSTATATEEMVGTTIDAIGSTTDLISASSSEIATSAVSSYAELSHDGTVVEGMASSAVTSTSTNPVVVEATSIVGEIFDQVVDIINPLDLAQKALESLAALFDNNKQAASAEEEANNLEDVGVIDAVRLRLSVAEIMKIATSSSIVSTSTVEEGGVEKSTSSIDAITIWYSLEASSSTAASELWQEVAIMPIGSSTNCSDIKTSYDCLKETIDQVEVGGYLSFALPFLKDKEQLDSLRIKISGQAGGDVKYDFLLDSLWLTVDYEEADQDDGYRGADKIVIDGKEINFNFTDENSNENLIIMSNAKDYAGVNETEVYFSVTNIGSSSEKVVLQAHFPFDMGEMGSLERLKLKEQRWTREETHDREILEPNFITSALVKKPQRKFLPETMKAKKSTKKGSKIGPGKTQYYKMKINFPVMSQGEFYIEAVGEHENYGLLDPWWSSSWLYKLPITIDNTGSNVAQAEYQVLVEISSTTAGFWSKVMSNGADIRFTNASQTVALPFWIQYWNKAGSSTQIWVKTDAIPASATTTIYMFYGNSAAASTSDMYSTFSYSTTTPIYHVVNSNFGANASITVASLIDNNMVQMNNGVIYNLDKLGTTTFTGLTATSVIKVLGPISGVISNATGNSDALVPIAFAGKQFVYPQITGTESFARYSPWITGTTTIWDGGTLDNTTIIPVGTAATVANNITATAILEASSSVLTYSWSSTPGYSMIGVPTTMRDLYGIKSGTNYIGQGATAGYSIFCSAGTGANMVGQLRTARTTIAACTASNNGVGSAVRIANATAPIGAIQYNDGDGAETTVFYPDVELASEYIMPKGAQYVAIACPPKYGTSTIDLYTANGTLANTSTCGVGTSSPGKSYFGSTTTGVFVGQGSRVVSRGGQPFYAYFENGTAMGTVGGDETNLLGAVQGRKNSLVPPIVTIGTELSFAIVISGKVYSDEGSTALLTSPIVSLVIDGKLIGTTSASGATGIYSFNYATTTTPKAGSSTLVYLDNGTEFGATYSRYVGNGDIIGLDIYKDRIIARHDDAGPLTNSDINKWDNDQDANIKTRVNAGNLQASSSQMLYIWASSTFTPGGTVTLDPGAASTSPGGDLKISTSSAVFDVDANTASIGGDWYSNGSFLNLPGQLITFTATSSGYTISNNGQNFSNVVFNGAGGGWSFVGTTTLDSDLTMTAGTLTGTSSLTVNGGDVTGNGVISLSAGSLTIASTGSFGGNSSWLFYDLNIGTGTLATTTKTGNGSISVQDDFLVATSTTLNLATSTWIVAGTGTPFTVLGNLIASTSLFKYTATSSAVTVATTTYYNLELAPSAAGSPTYTLQGGNLNINNYLYIGDGVNPVTVNASTNNTIIDVAGNYRVSTSSTFVASAVNGLAVGGNWNNTGIFTASGGVVTFDATTTGKIINAGSSAFATVAFNNALGGWTIAQNATATGNWSLVAGTQFTVATSVTMAVQGQYIRSISGASTTWANATLYLNGTSQNLNAKADGGDVYGTLQIGNNMNITMWNSSAATTTVATTSSLYSMDNAAIDGNLYIWGAYTATSTVNWSYGTDFDGTSLAGSPRQANVRIASSSVVTISSSTLNMVGTSTASTTITNQGTGFFALNIATSTLNARYYQLNNAGLQGLNIYGSSSVASMDYGDITLGASNYSMISINAQSMTNSGSSSFDHMRFASSTGVTTGVNINLSGTPSVYWNFSTSTGNMASENYDVDAGDPRGYLIWSDSPEWTPKSQNWRWYHDQTAETPIVPMANEVVAPSGVARDSTLKLRMTIKETLNLPGYNVKMRLQYSTAADFSSGVVDVAENGSTTALWTYGDGVDLDNAIITTRVLTDSTTTATHNESGVSTSSFNVLASSSNEYEFTLYNNSGANGVTYYFRAYSPQYKLGNVDINTGESYPSIVVGANSLATVISGVATSTVLNGVTTNFASTPLTMNYGKINFGTSYVGAQQLSISTNGETGYQLFVRQTQDLTTYKGIAMTSVTADNANPLAWPTGQTPAAFGYHTSDVTLSGANPSRFTADNTYAKFETSMREVGYSPTPVANDPVNIIYRMEVTSSQVAGDYQGSVNYIVVPTY